MFTATSTATIMKLTRKGINIEVPRWSLTDAALTIHAIVNFPICVCCIWLTALFRSAPSRIRSGLNPSRRVEFSKSRTFRLFSEATSKKQDWWKRSSVVRLTASRLRKNENFWPSAGLN
jgi:hypothetical protein